jgi:hypothetical protein
VAAGHALSRRGSPTGTSSSPLRRQCRTRANSLSAWALPSAEACRNRTA